jgi:hypothetical protein
MGNQAVADFLAAYTGHSRSHLTETNQERYTRITTYDAMPPFAQAVANLLYLIDNQVGANRPQDEVFFSAGQIQGWASELRSALKIVATAPEAAALESPAPGL